MVHIGYVYVPRPSKRNLEIGLKNNIWGWRTRALDRAGARKDLQTFQIGDYLVFGHHGPNTRTKEIESWEKGVIRRLLVTRITTPLYVDASPMWPDKDEAFPERVKLDFLLDTENVDGLVLGTAALEKLKDSANKGGVVLIGDDPSVLERLGSPPSPGLPSQDHAQRIEEDDRVLGVDTNLSGYAHVLVRKEQQKLRRIQCGNAMVLRCDLCGRSLPRRMVRTAHIKKRSRCTHDEQRSLKNLMLACTAGCDEMFEHGYIYVDHVGVIRKSPLSTATNDLDALAHRLSGHLCAGYDGKQAYFGWHRENIAGVTTP
jgi:hypothetical protein